MPSSPLSLYGLLVPSAQSISEARRSACAARFCPTARGEARGDSDVHLFFDLPPGPLGLFELMEVEIQRQYPQGEKAR